MRTTFVFLIVLFLLPKITAAQSKYQQQTSTGLRYWANDDVEVLGFSEEYLSKGFEDGVLLSVKTYAVHTNQETYYTTITPSGMVFDFENQTIRFKEKYAIIIPDIEMENDKPLYYTFSKESEKPNRKMLAFRVLDYSDLTEADSAKTIHHIPEKMLNTAQTKKLGIYQDNDGKRFIYMKISTGHVYLKLPLVEA